MEKRSTNMLIIIIITLIEVLLIKKALMTKVKVMTLTMIPIISDKKGPIYNVLWSPKNTEFCVIFGCILLLVIISFYGDSANWYTVIVDV